MAKIPLRALILDYGGVISLPQDPENLGNLLRSLSMDGNDFHEAYRKQRAPYDRGQVSGEQYWSAVLRDLGRSPQDADLAHLVQEDVHSWTRLSQDMIQFISARRSQVHKLAVISNMTFDTLAYMRRHFDWLALFDALCFSCELGINKPEREIYQACLRQLALRAGECLFVDDSARNVHGAREAGMHAILFTDFPAFLREVEEVYSFTR